MIMVSPLQTRLVFALQVLLLQAPRLQLYIMQHVASLRNCCGTALILAIHLVSHCGGMRARHYL